MAGKRLDVQELLEYARAGVAILRGLEISDARMSYSDFGRAIGLLAGPNAPWEAWHRQQIKAILSAIAAVEKLAGTGAMPLDYKRIINVQTGRSGKGVSKSSRIVTK
jgi:hypothetical protein